jgi:sugar lactone lactonase YvrE
VSFSADGISLTPDGRYLYWQAVKGKTLYRIATDALQNTQLSGQSQRYILIVRRKAFLPI